MSKISNVLFTVGLVGASASLAGCDSATSSSNDPRLEAPIVRIAEVRPVGETERSFTGLVAARVQSNLTFRVAGKVTERLVDTGQSVTHGQPLMRIDRTDYEHAIVAQRGSVAAAKARMMQAVADEARYEPLVASGAVSKSAYDQAKAAADSARALFKAAEAQLMVAENEGQYATLVADSDGMIMETLAEPGQFVGAGQVVMRLAQAGPREAVVDLPETLRPAVGSDAQASLYGVGGLFPARLRQLSDAADPLTRTFEARYVLDGEAAAAPLGTTVTIHIPSGEKAPALMVPLGAIDDRGNGPGVWVLDGKQDITVSFQPVKLHHLGSEQAVLTSGPKLGDRIVALGGYALHEGQNVRIAEQREGSK